jgi:hypothetical protein
MENKPKIFLKITKQTGKPKVNKQTKRRDHKLNQTSIIKQTKRHK